MPSSYEAGEQCPKNSLDPAEVHRATKFSMVARVGDGRLSSQSTTHQLPQRDGLRLLGHLAGADPSQSHSHILRPDTSQPFADWRRQAGRPRRTWLHTIELDLQPHNFGLNTA